jgi:nucleoside-diphosphate-sugar epimerase
MDGDKPLVLITGSSGLIGSATVRRLSGAFRVIGLDDEMPEDIALLEEFVPLELQKKDNVEKALRHVQERYGEVIASVIHLAAYHDFSGEPSPLYEEVTVRGTERLLNAVRAIGIEQFVYASTMLVHSPTTPGRPIDETWPLEPKWDYPRSKVQAERIVAAFAGNVPTVVLRIAGVYDADCHSIPLSNQIQRIYERRLIGHVFPGDLSHGQAFVHMDDVVEVIERVVRLRHQLPAQETFLVAEPETLSYAELQEVIGEALHGEPWRTETIPKAVAKAGAWLEDQVPGEEPFIKPWMIDIADDHYEVDVAHARRLLGFEPWHRLRQEMPRILERMKRDPVKFYRDNRLELPSFLKKGAEGEPAPAHP